MSRGEENIEHCLNSKAEIGYSGSQIQNPSKGLINLEVKEHIVKMLYKK